MVRLTWVTTLLLGGLLGTPLWSAEDVAKKSALDLLPNSTVVYVEMPQPGRLMDTVLDHPLARQLEQQPDYQRAFDTPDMQHLREAVRQFEDKLGTKWRPALRSLTADGIYLGVELGTVGVVVLVRSRDEALLKKTKDTFLELARAEAEKKGAEDPIETEEYHGVTTYTVGEAYYATLGPWLILTNKARLVQMVIDNGLEAGRPSLGGEPQFQQALQAKVGAPTVWSYADLTVLRVTGVAKKVFPQKSDNPAAELLIGGILAAAPDAPYVTSSLEIEAERIAFTTAIPFDKAKVGEIREYYFGPGGSGASPALLAPKQTIFAFSAYRDFGLMWKRAPDLFNENINAKFAEAESGLATLFSGRSFPDDILANLEPGVQLVVARQTFGEDDPTPQIRLPAAAVVFRMKNPERTSQQFKITFQSLIGFLNIAGAGGGVKEGLELDTDKLGKITLVSAKYLPPEQGQEPGIHFNASPSVAFVNDQFILSSSRGLALELAQQFEKNAPQPDAGVNTQMRLAGDAFRAVLEDNRRQLVAQNQEEKGHSQADAEKEIDLFMKLLAGLRETSLRLTTSDATLRLSWELQLAK